MSTHDEPTADESPGIDLHARVRRLEATVIALAVALAGALAWATLGTPADRDVLTAERLEIVEPDGEPAFVLANSERPAVATLDGEVLMEGQAQERALSNFIFFDGQGDEVGGMLFGNRESADGFSASRHLSLDAYEQDQTVQLFHRQNPEWARAGLRVADRPEDRSLRETFAEIGLEVPITREGLDSAIAALPDQGRADSLRALFGVRRLFLGSSGENEATLVLRDGEERPRIVLGVPEAGEPYVRVLDEEGESVAEMP